MKTKKLKEIINFFHNKNVLVIGDCMMDQWVWGKVDRISPEAPVPVVDVDSYSFTPGGACNVVNNLCALGAKVSLAGVVGSDFIGKKLKRDLRHRGVDIKGIIEDKRRPTTLKTRIVAHSQQVVRADYEKKSKISPEACKCLIKFLDNKLKNLDIIIVSDYNKGVITLELMRELIARCREYKVKIIAGPKPENIDLFKEVAIVSFNQKEASTVCGFPINSEKSLLKAGKQILRNLKSEGVLITRGEKGMILFDWQGNVSNISALTSQVYDVSGAGDTVLSVLSLGLAAGAKLCESALLANYAASIVVKKVGTATLTSQELIEAVG